MTFRVLAIVQLCFSGSTGYIATCRMLLLPFSYTLTLCTFRMRAAACACVPAD